MFAKVGSLARIVTSALTHSSIIRFASCVTLFKHATGMGIVCQTEIVNACMGFLDLIVTFVHRISTAQVVCTVARKPVITGARVTVTLATVLVPQTSLVPLVTNNAIVVSVLAMVNVTQC